MFLWALIAMLGGAASGPPAAAPPKVLIVADELPAMQVLAAQLQSLEKVESVLVRQQEMPASLEAFTAVIVYIHGRLEASTEEALLQYARHGGRLILIHHSISWGKRLNARWFSALGVELLEGSVDAGGYKWIEGVTIEVVNLAPRHHITTHKVEYPDRVSYPDRTGQEKDLPGIRFLHSEVYLNHRLPDQRTILLGLRYRDPVSGKVWNQQTAGWLKPLGKGHVVYFMPGHTSEEFRNPAYVRLIANAVIWKP